MTLSPRTKLGSSADAEKRVTQLGVDLGSSLKALLEEIPGAPHAPQNLARTLSLDKVFTSRLLKAMRNHDALALVHHIPGPEPLRRLARSARRRGCTTALVKSFEAIVDQFEHAIREEAGDRSSFGALLSTWLPTAREELEVRHRQAAYKAMSLLKGSSVDMNYSAVFLHPSTDAGRLDVVWVFGIYGLKRMRPGAIPKFTTRRVGGDAGPRHPLSINGENSDDFADMRLDQFCHSPPAPLEIVQVDEAVHYVLGDSGFGPSSAVDFVFAELNESEMASVLPQGSNRKGWVFSSIGLPSRQMQFDVFVHKDVYPDRAPELLLYDTSTDGAADVNDRVRDIDRFESADSVESLGTGLSQLRSKVIPDYANLIEHIHGQLQWTPDDFRGYSVRIDYPIVGSQVTLAFQVPETESPT